MALIASLLLSLWVGRAPTKRTYELLCFYLRAYPETLVGESGEFLDSWRTT
jgi:hypothetical protein